MSITGFPRISASAISRARIMTLFHFSLIILLLSSIYKYFGACSTRVEGFGNDCISFVSLLYLFCIREHHFRLIQFHRRSLKPRQSPWIPGSFWNRSARFVDLECMRLEVQGEQSGAIATKSRSEQTHALLASSQSQSEAAQTISNALVSKLAVEFGQSKGNIDTSLALTEIGVDSLVAIELCNWIGTTLGVNCSIFDMMQSSSLADLIEGLASKTRLLQVDMS